MKKKEAYFSPKNISTGQLDVSRRKFLKIVGGFTLSAGSTSLLSCVPCPCPDDSDSQFSAEGYIVVDSRKCQGCLSCMLACSIAHEGSANLSLARLQVTQNPFKPFPDDTAVNQCHQCVDSPCVTACPTGALKIDTKNGNLRVVDPSLCVGCGSCRNACALTPQRSVIAPDPAFQDLPKSRKCDLCLNAAHHFHPDGGGVNGVQVCAAVCPLNAIKFVTSISSLNNGGYDRDLRKASWNILGFSAR